MTRRAGIWGLVLLALLALLPFVAAAAEPGRKARAAFESTHNAWAGAMRWGDNEERLAFLDVLAQDGVDDFSLRRWDQIRISGYRERARRSDPQGRVRLRAEVGLINIHTQAERTVVVEELWEWLPEQGGWRLVSGLPALWPDA